MTTRALIGRRVVTQVTIASNISGGRFTITAANNYFEEGMAVEYSGQAWSNTSNPQKITYISGTTFYITQGYSIPNNTVVDIVSYGTFITKTGTEVTTMNINPDKFIVNTNNESGDFFQFPATGNASTSTAVTSTVTTVTTAVAATGTVAVVLPDLDFSNVRFIGVGTGYIPSASISGTSTSATITKPSTFTVRGLTYNNVADSANAVSYFAFTDIF
jgi:hypothetical protein